MSSKKELTAQFLWRSSVWPLPPIHLLGSWRAPPWLRIAAAVWLLYTLEELLGRSLSQQRIVVMIAMISKRSPPTQSTTTTTTTKRNNNIAITMITDLVTSSSYTTKSSTLTLQACFVLGFLLQTSLAYRLDPNPQTNSIFATVPSSSISSSSTSSSQTSSQLSSSSKHGVKVFYQSGVSNSNFINI